MKRCVHDNFVVRAVSSTHQGGVMKRCVHDIKTGKRACAEGISEQLAVEASDRVVGPIARRLKAELRSSAI